nr:MAG TPA: hypothetical protein [Caudoviricetes sp.]
MCSFYLLPKKGGKCVNTHRPLGPVPGVSKRIAPVFSPGREVSPYRGNSFSAYFFK